MNIKCNCPMTTRAVGDGCGLCNTELYIDMLDTPEEVAEQLRDNAFFTHDQADYIASEVYQPLLGIIQVLNEKLDQVIKEVK